MGGGRGTGWLMLLAAVSGTGLGSRLSVVNRASGAFSGKMGPILPSLRRDAARCPTLLPPGKRFDSFRTLRESSRSCVGARKIAQVSAHGLGSQYMEVGSRVTEGAKQMFDPIVHANDYIQNPWNASVRGDEYNVLFQPLFSWMLKYLRENLNDLEVVELDSDHALHVGGISSERRTRMGTLLFQSKLFRRIRLTHYDGGNTQVLNSLWYPRHHIDAPLLGINLISFGPNQKQLCIIDFQPLQDSHKNLAVPLGEIYHTFPALNQSISARFYDGRFFSPSMLVGKFNCQSDMKSIGFPATRRAVELYVQMVRSCPEDYSKKEALAKLQQEYNSYNIDKDPSLSIYKAEFGAAWGQDYIENVKFA